MKRQVYLVGVACCAVLNFAAADSTHPSSGPALSALQQMHTALALSPKDGLLVSSLNDGPDPLEQNAFYRMMRIVADIPPLSQSELRQLDAPAWANLLRDPNRYRGKPVRMKVRVYVVRKLTWGEGLRANPYWPAEKPLYELHATTDGSPDEPLLLYSAVEPTKLGEASETLDDGTERYKSGPAYEIAGVYLQYYTGKTQIDGAKRNYPVVSAWQIEPSKHDAGSFFGPFTMQEQLYTWGAALVVLIAAVGMFVFVQRRIRRPSAARQGVVFKKYKPLRDEEPEDKSEDDEYVDPDLSSAVEEYQRDHTENQNPEKGNEDNA